MGEKIINVSYANPSEIIVEVKGEKVFTAVAFLLRLLRHECMTFIQIIFLFIRILTCFVHFCEVMYTSVHRTYFYL